MATVEKREAPMAGQAMVRLIAEAAELGAIALFVVMVLVWGSALTAGV